MLGFNCKVRAGLASAAPASALLTEFFESCAQAESKEIAAHARRQSAKRGASPAINPARRLTDVIKDPLIGTGAHPSEAKSFAAIDHNAGTYSWL